jgi:OOP family OmpA-OmpF porin
LTIQNDGKGTAIVSGHNQRVEVPADPLPHVPKLGSFPPLDSMVPHSYSGILITLDSALLFDFDKSEIRPDALKVISTVAQALKENNVPAATIEGHTDSIGAESYNQTLSEQRAQAVLDALKAGGVNTKLDAKGYGMTRPVAPNTTSDGNDNPGGRQLNRRVEIYIPVF